MPILSSVLLSPNRSKNEVDRLQERIWKLQKACTHEFRLREKPAELKESLVKGVFIGFTLIEEDFHRNRLGVLHLQCLKCSMQKNSSMETMCPHCLGKMMEGHLESRKKYHSELLGYYASLIRKCSACGLALVFDEWDQ